MTNFMILPTSVVQLGKSLPGYDAVSEGYGFRMEQAGNNINIIKKAAGWVNVDYYLVLDYIKTS